MLRMFILQLIWLVNIMYDHFVFYFVFVSSRLLTPSLVVIFTKAKWPVRTNRCQTYLGPFWTPCRSCFDLENDESLWKIITSHKMAHRVSSEFSGVPKNSWENQSGMVWENTADRNLSSIQHSSVWTSTGLNCVLVSSAFGSCSLIFFCNNKGLKKWERKYPGIDL